MGTQFSSRLRSPVKRAKIRDSIKSSLSAAPKKPGRSTRDIELLSSLDQLKVGRLTVGGILNVAEDSDFFDLFAESQVFEEVLTWLRELWVDATANGFKDSIKDYKLEEASTPSLGLSNALREITKKNKSKDSFSVAASNAAMSILAQTAGRTAASKDGDSQAKIYGKKLTLFSIEQLINQYIENFMTELLSKIIRMVNPDNPRDKLIQDAIKLSGKTSKQIARAVVKRIEENQKLRDIKYIHNAVVDELRQISVEATKSPR